MILSLLSGWVGSVCTEKWKAFTNSIMTSFSIPFAPPTMVKFVAFHSLRMWAKSLQIFGPSSHELPIRVCENTGGSGLVTWPGLWPIGRQFGECSLGGHGGSVFRLLCCCCLLRSMLSFTDYSDFKQDHCDSFPVNLTLVAVWKCCRKHWTVCHLPTRHNIKIIWSHKKYGISHCFNGFLIIQDDLLSDYEDNQSQCHICDVKNSIACDLHLF